MPLKLKGLDTISVDAKTFMLYENSQDYVDGDDHGWGRGDPVINRTDRAVIAFAKIIDVDGNEELMDTLSGYDPNFHVSPGDQQLNTDKTRFDFTVSVDGHYKYWLYAAEQAASAPAPVLNGIYYDTAEGRLKISDGTLWRDFVVTDLSVIEGSSSTTGCERMYFVRKVKLKNKFTRLAYPLVGRKDEKYVGLVEELNNYIFLMGSTFPEGKQATARKFLEMIEDQFHEKL